MPTELNKVDTTDTVVVAPVATVSRAKRLAGSLKRHWRATVISILVIGLLVLIFSLVPVVPVNKLLLVNMGASVQLQDGQTARLKTQNVTVKVLHFTNQTCAVVGKCFGNDTKSVEYELSVNGNKYATGSAVPASNSPYQVTTLSSDYKTYATVKIIKTP